MVYQRFASLKKRLRLPASLRTIQWIFSLTLFKKTPILQAFFNHDCHHYTQPNDQPGLPGSVNNMLTPPGERVILWQRSVLTKTM